MSPKESNRVARAEPKFLDGIFSVPEDHQKALHHLEQELTKNLDAFLTESKVTGEIPLQDLLERFSDTEIPTDPTFVSDEVNHLLEEVIPYCVHTGSPKFIGHMTSAIPYFLQSLSKCMVAIHQNTVKIETSRALTVLERQSLAKLHRLTFAKDEAFYKRNTHRRDTTLGILCSGGTVANIIALWVARNRFMESVLGPSYQDLGLVEALQRSGHKNLCCFVSQRGHYSLKKSADLLGMGNRSLIAVPVDRHHRIHLPSLEQAHRKALEEGLKPLALIGIAGTTETGNVDPLNDLADFAQRESLHYHVDAAWGGPTLFSEQNAHRLKGIERADSVAMDGHKQFYLPMGIGMLLLNDPTVAMSIEHQAQYIIRASSFDLGRRHLEGSRPGMSMLLSSALRIMGRQGYELLMNRNLRMARTFASMIEAHPDFELITPPELNILTYRAFPRHWREKGGIAQDHIDALNTQLQKQQREAGQSFVSRTRFRHPEPNGPETTVLRAVLANPLTREHHLKEILEEQSQRCQALIQQREFLL